MLFFGVALHSGRFLPLGAVYSHLQQLVKPLHGLLAWDVVALLARLGEELQPLEALSRFDDVVQVHAQGFLLQQGVDQDHVLSVHGNGNKVLVLVCR